MRCAFPFVLLAAACATTSQTTPPATPPLATPAEKAAAPLPPPDPDAPLKKEVQALRDEAAAVLKAQSELAWKSWALGEAADFSAAYKGHDALFGLESVKKVKALRAKEKDPDRLRALLAFQLFLASEYAARATADASEAVAHLSATSTLSVDGQELPFRELEALLANEGHTGKRRKIFTASNGVITRLNGPLRDRERKLAEVSTALGYPSFLAFELELRQADAKSLAALAEELLLRTEPSYRAAMEELSRRELGMPLAQVRRADLPRLFRTGDVDSYFPKEKTLERLTGALARMGLDPAKLVALKIDSAPKPRKNPRALAIVVEAGQDVRLSLRPTAGLSAASQLFHEAGHALFYALAKTDLEIQLLGSSAVGEGYGFLFEDLLDDPGFGEAMGIPPAKLAAHAKTSALRKLFLARRHAGRVLFEIAWRSDPQKAQKPEALYQEAMTRALGFPAEPEDGARAFADNEDFLVAADYLRGLVAAAQLEASLSSELGPSWWSDVKAGARIALWLAPGGKPTVEEVMQAAGAKGLDAGPLAQAFEQRLAPAKKATP